MNGAEKAMVALAIGAHPDDIEFMMAGTLLRLKQAGAEIHMWNLANGSCGTVYHDRDEIIALRRAECEASAREAGARYHGALVDDLAILYEPHLLARVAAEIRRARPQILLVPSPQDYMEDHMNTSRLAVTAAFARGMRNYVTDPPVPPYEDEVVLYHALPYGLRDGLRQRVQPEYYVDIAPVLAAKRAMLAQHRTQAAWLDASQGVGSYLAEMEDLARQVGTQSGRFAWAEGWRRHAHLGFSSSSADPLRQLLGAACWIDPAYEATLG
jgi:N-acetylglucosamine malate deacetylase 1